MKKLIIIAVIFFSAAQVMAQNTSGNGVNENHNNVTVNVTREMSSRPLEIALPANEIKSNNPATLIIPVNTSVFANRYKSLFWYHGRNIYA